MGLSKKQVYMIERFGVEEINGCKSRKQLLRTRYRGEMQASYADVRRIFGVPMRKTVWDDGKSKAQWCIAFVGDEVISIYDYKESCARSKIARWHIGGTMQDAVATVKAIFKAEGGKLLRIRKPKITAVKLTKVC